MDKMEFKDAQIPKTQDFITTYPKIMEKYK